MSQKNSASKVRVRKYSNGVYLVIYPIPEFLGGLGTVEMLAYDPWYALHCIKLRLIKMGEFSFAHEQLLVNWANQIHQKIRPRFQ